MNILDEQFLTAEELAGRLRTTKGTITRLHQAGRLPRPIKPGGRRLLWLKSDIELYLAKLRREAGYEPAR